MAASIGKKALVNFHSPQTEATDWFQGNLFGQMHFKLILVSM